MPRSLAGSLVKPPAAPCGRNGLGIRGVCDADLRPRLLHSFYSVARRRSDVRPCTKLDGLAHGREPKAEGRQAAQIRRRKALRNRPFPGDSRPDAHPATKRSEKQADLVGIRPANGAYRKGPSPEELRLIAELTREKNNLNQLAKAQNAAGAAVREAELVRIIRFYNQTINRLKRKTDIKQR